MVTQNATRNTTRNLMSQTGENLNTQKKLIFAFN